MKINEISPKHPDYWKARTIDVLGKSGTDGLDVGDLKKLHDRRFQKVIPILEKNCKEIIAVYKKAGKYLLRGARGRENDIFVIGIRPDRKAGYLEKWVAQEEPSVVKELGGVANRSNSIFTTTSPITASTWGTDVFIVFPKDGWHTTYFKKFGGEYMYDPLTSLAFRIHPDDSEFSEKRIREAIKKLFIAKGISFNKNQLPKYMREKREMEVLISGNSYIGLQANIYRARISKWLGI